MVLESLISAKMIERKPIFMGLLGIIVPSVCIVLTRLFSGTKGLLLVFLITMAMVPVIVKLMRIEEKRDLLKGSFWEKHGHILEAFGVYFISVTLTLSFWFAFLPPDFSQQLFAEQISEIQRIRGESITGEVSGTGRFTIANDIILNNIYVMFLSFVLSFVFASGAIFILTWNASVLAIVVGHIAQKTFGTAAAIPLALAGFAPHGIPEIAAYLMAGLAGGILSFAVERHKIMSPQFVTVAKDATLIFLGAVGLIVIGGVVESFLLV